MGVTVIIYHSYHALIRLEEVGPYSFKQSYERANTSYSQDGNLLDFYKLKHWEFDPQQSQGDLHDEIWSVNMIVLTPSEAVR